MEKGSLSWGFFLLAIILLISGCSQNRSEPSQSDIPEGELFNPDFDLAGPPTIIYKTKADYYTLVPLTLSDDRAYVVSYPDVQDVYYNGNLSYPTRLEKGYLLDNRGLSAYSAFLEITYEEYSAQKKTPSSAELYERIAEDDPFLEIYDCGNRYQFVDEMSEINAIIRSGQLKRCKSLI